MFSNLCNLVSGIFMTLCQSFFMALASSHASKATKWTLMGLDFKTYELFMISETVCAFEKKPRIEGFVLHRPKYARPVSQARISGRVNAPNKNINIQATKIIVSFNIKSFIHFYISPYPLAFVLFRNTNYDKKRIFEWSLTRSRGTEKLTRTQILACHTSAPVRRSSSRKTWKITDFLTSMGVFYIFDFFFF